MAGPACRLCGVRHEPGAPRWNHRQLYSQYPDFSLPGYAGSTLFGSVPGSRQRSQLREQGAGMYTCGQGRWSPCTVSSGQEGEKPSPGTGVFPQQIKNSLPWKDREFKAVPEPCRARFRTPAAAVCAFQVTLSAAILPARRPKTMESPVPEPSTRWLPWNPPVTSPAAYRPGMGVSLLSRTWVFSLISRPPMK